MIEARGVKFTGLWKPRVGVKYVNCFDLQFEGSFFGRMKMDTSHGSSSWFIILFKAVKNHGFKCVFFSAVSCLVCSFVHSAEGPNFHITF